MTDLFDLTSRPSVSSLGRIADANDPRVGELILSDPSDYSASEIVIVGCPQDEGARRCNARTGSAEAPDRIRSRFYGLTTFNIKRRLFDLGNIIIGGTLEETHDRHSAVIRQLLQDGKRIIVLGGSNDLSYPDGTAMAEIFGSERWLAINVDSQLGVSIAAERNSSTPYRQLLDEDRLSPTYFYEVGYQTHLASPVYYDYIRRLGINRISLELLRSRDDVDLELRDNVRQKFIGHSSSLSTLFSFSMNVIRSADAPGTSGPFPLGLRAGEFITLVKYAASLANTKLIEFTNVIPSNDIDDRTSQLVAIGMHRFCTGVA